VTSVASAAMRAASSRRRTPAVTASVEAVSTRSRALVLGARGVVAVGIAVQATEGAAVEGREAGGELEARIGVPGIEPAERRLDMGKAQAAEGVAVLVTGHRRPSASVVAAMGGGAAGASPPAIHVARAPSAARSACSMEGGPNGRVSVGRPESLRARISTLVVAGV